MMKRFAAIAAAATVMAGAGAGLTATPAEAAASCPTVRYGSSGSCAKLAQSLLKKHGFYSGAVDGRVKASTVNAVINYQRAKRMPDTGQVGAQTWSALKAAKQPATYTGIPSSCRSGANVICASKSMRRVMVFKNGKLVKTVQARFGGWNRDRYGRMRVHQTINGTYKVYRKAVSPYSKRYGFGAMPYSLIFDPNMYVHGSPDFDRTGYAGASHGCVNLHVADAKWMYANMPVGTKIVVY